MNGYQIGVIIASVGVLLLCVAQLLTVMQSIKEQKSRALKVKLNKAVEMMSLEQLKELKRKTL